MSPEAQRIAIAEACGWKHIAFNRGWIKAGDGETQCVIPDYLNDLNAMHGAEQCLWRKDFLARDTFIDHLARILNPVHGYRDQLGQHLLDATAAQRAEAFLRTLGKWEDAK